MDPLTDGFAELDARDPRPALLERFYVEALGLACCAREDDRVWLAAGAARPAWALDAGREGVRRRGRAARALRVLGRAGPARRARRASRPAARRSAGPRSTTGGDRSLYVEDPEGNVVELWDFFERGRPVEELGS